MASAAELAIIFKGDDKASAMMNKLGQNATQMGKTFQKAGVAMVAAGGAVLAVLGKSVKDWAKAGDEVQKMALRTNWAAESLSELRHVANIAGTELNALEKGTKKLNMAIVDASSGLTTYIRYFDMLGLKAENLKAMKPEDAFWAVANALASMTNEVEQGAVAAQLFGRAGTQMLPMLAEGADGIQRLREEAHELGIVFNQEAAEAAADLTDAFQRVGEAINGIKFAMAEALAPSIEEASIKLQGLITSIGNFVAENPGMVKALGAGALALVGAGGLALAFGTLIRSMTTILPLLASVTGGIGALATAALAAAGLFGGAMIAFGGYLLNQNAQIKAYNEAVAETFDLFNQEWGKNLAGQANDWAGAALKVLGVYEGLIQAGRELTPEYRAHYELLKKTVNEHYVLKGLAEERNAKLQETARIEAEEIASTLEKEKELRVELNRQAREQCELQSHYAEQLRASWAEQDARVRGIAEGQKGNKDLSHLTPQGAADYWGTTLDMLKSGTNLQFLEGLDLDFSMGTPSQASIDAAIKRAEEMQALYADNAATLAGGNIDITLEVDGQVLASVTSDVLGNLLGQE